MLLTKLSGSACHRDLILEYSEQTESPLSKFMVTIKLNFGEEDKKIAYKVGQEKARAKREACIMRLRPYVHKTMKMKTVIDC